MTVNLPAFVGKIASSIQPNDRGGKNRTPDAPRFEDALSNGKTRRGPMRDLPGPANEGLMVRPFTFGQPFTQSLLPDDAIKIPEPMPDGMDPLVKLESEAAEPLLIVLPDGAAAPEPTDGDTQEPDTIDDLLNEIETLPRVTENEGTVSALPEATLPDAGATVPSSAPHQDAAAPARAAEELKSVPPTEPEQAPKAEDARPALLDPEPVETARSAATNVPIEPARANNRSEAPRQPPPAQATVTPVAYQLETPISEEFRPSEPILASQTRDAIQRPAADLGGGTGSGSNRNQTPAPPPDASGRVAVLAYNTSMPPAPALAPLPAVTIAGLVATIDADPSWRAAAEASNVSNDRTRTAITATSSLRIQLNPAELGVVTARLTMTGSQLSIEIQAESSDARQRLANDTEAILKALKVAGIDVEKVTIQQAPAANSGANQQGASSRDTFGGNQPANADRNEREQGRQQGATQQGEQTGHGRDMDADRSGGGLYI